MFLEGIGHFDNVQAPFFDDIKTKGPKDLQLSGFCFALQLLFPIKIAQWLSAAKSETKLKTTKCKLWLLYGFWNGFQHTFETSRCYQTKSTRNSQSNLWNLPELPNNPHPAKSCNQVRQWIGHRLLHAWRPSGLPFWLQNRWGVWISTVWRHEIGAGLGTPLKLTKYMPLEGVRWFPKNQFYGNLPSQVSTDWVWTLVVRSIELTGVHNGMLFTIEVSPPATLYLVSWLPVSNSPRHHYPFPNSPHTPHRTMPPPSPPGPVGL